MVKITHGPIVSSASGAVGPIVLVEGFFGPYARTRVRPHQKITSKRWWNRFYWKRLMSWWAYVWGGARNTWTAEGTQHGVHGVNRFITRNHPFRTTTIQGYYAPPCPGRPPLTDCHLGYFGGNYLHVFWNTAGPKPAAEVGLRVLTKDGNFRNFLSHTTFETGKLFCGTNWTDVAAIFVLTFDTTSLQYQDSRLTDIPEPGEMEIHRVVDTTGYKTIDSTSWEDLDATNLSITLPSPSGWCMIIFNTSLQSVSTATHANLDLTIDGTRVGGAWGLSEIYFTTSGERQHLCLVWLAEITGTNVVVRVQGKATPAGKSFYAYADAAYNPAHLSVIELE